MTGSEGGAGLPPASASRANPPGVTESNTRDSRSHSCALGACGTGRDKTKATEPDASSPSLPGAGNT